MNKKVIAMIGAVVLSVSAAGCQNAAGESSNVRPQEGTAQETQQTTNTTQTTDTQSLIGEDEAKNIALQDAGVAESDVSYLRVQLVVDDGVQEYEVDFYAGNQEYDYDIDASTGDIRSKDMDIDYEFQSGTAQSGTQNGTLIGENEAKNIALQDAGVAEADVSYLRVQLGMDDGVQEYEVDFYAGNQEYDYDIDASTGAIRSKDTDIEYDFMNGNAQTSTQSSGTGQTISEADAKAIALAEVPGATEQDMRIKLDHDDGRQIYEGTIYYDQMEYEFEIDAESGSIISWEADQWD